MEYRDYYATLGVARTATEAEIKKAWRRLARRYHPDVNQAPDAQKRMQEINEAWEVLGDAQKRAAYDQLGSGWQAGEAFRPPPGRTRAPRGFADRGEDPGMDEFSAFFESLFGGARGARRRSSHAFDTSGFGMPGFDDLSGPDEDGVDLDSGDQHAAVRIALEDTFHGATRTLLLPAADGGERRLEVRIPRGIRAGQQIRLAGQGLPRGRGRPPGDLYLEVQLEPHGRYRVEGRDLHVTLKVAPWEAALGASVPVATPDGTVELQVPPGSQSGRRLRLKGRGIPSSPPGDFYAVLEVVLPPADTAKAQASYRRMAQDLAFNPRED